MQELLDAINRLNNALNDLEKRQAAFDIGVAIGNELGTGSGLYRTPAQIEAMSNAEINAWGANIEASVAETEVPPSA